MTQNEDFGRAVASAWWQLLPVFSNRFLHITTEMCVWNVFSMCFCIFIFWPKVRICKGYSLCWVAFFGNFQYGLNFRLFDVLFEPFFFIEQLQCVVVTFLACFFAFLIFDPKWRFCKGYSLCLATIFGQLQSGLIFRILAFFSNRFSHITTAMCVRKVFSTFFSIFNFWPKEMFLG